MSKENVPTANPFEEAKTMVILKTKVVPEMALVYRGFEDLEKLISFVGTRPVLNTDLTLSFKKQIVEPNSVIFRDVYGQVTKVLTLDEASAIHDIAAQAEYNAEQHRNNVQAKEIKPRKAK